MSYRIIEVHVNTENTKVLDAISEKKYIIDFWKNINQERNRIRYSFFVRANDVQKITDAIDATLGYTETTRVIIIDVEATLPRVEEEMGSKKETIEESNKLSREELYNNIFKNSKLSSTSLMLVLFSTIVAAIGMIENSVTTIIGAMVIAPLLGPIVGFSFGIAINDRELIEESTNSVIKSFMFCVVLSFIIGVTWNRLIEGDIYQASELISRGSVGFYDVTIALVSGGAAALSITSGVSGALVGVMLAVAILPPLCATGIMLGFGEYVLSLNAFLLSLINLVCINIAAQTVFLFKKIRPRTSGEKEKAISATVRNLAIAILILVIIAFIMIYTENMKDISEIFSSEYLVEFKTYLKNLF